ncbi:MAG: UDP-N-acetylmuramate--L-alanine ligase [Phycisphaerae bacterium]
MQDVRSPGRPPEGSFTGRKVHLIGIGGAGMRALAAVLLKYGAQVSGSDLADSAALDQLRQTGAQITIGQRGENIGDDCQTVVHSAAVHEENPELIAARQRKLDVLKYSQMLGRLMATRRGVAVAGTHGKSTTTAMIAYTLTQAGADPTYIVGATVDQLGVPSAAGKGELFLAEACEFDRSFLNLVPHHAAVLNIEEDHLDCFRDLDAIIEAFRAFVALVPEDGVIVANAEDRNVERAVSTAAAPVETFGFDGGSFWRGEDLRIDRGRYRMSILRDEEPFCQLQMRLPGLHNAYNALAATALLHNAGLSAEQIAEHLGNFSGTDRRMTLKGTGRGVTVVDDYAHHPTEVQATLRALRDFYQPRRLLCVFQPHQHSRTRFLLKDFARSFGLADEVIVPDIYFVRDSDREKDYISSEDLVAQIRLCGGAAIYLKTFRDISRHLKDVLREGDLVVTMGAGNIWKVADETVHWLREDH